MSTDVRETPCQICGNKAYKGFHFQVDCCRACAAFYRRSIEAEKIFKCKQGRKNCELKAKIKGTPLCRYCRLERCKELGMRMQRKPSTTPSTDYASTSSPQPITTFSKFQKIHYISSEKFYEILSSSLPLAITFPCRLTFLHRLEYSFSKFHEQLKPKEIVLTDMINFEAFSRFYVKIKNEMAKVLMHCKEFVKLDFKDKLLLYKHVLYIFMYLENIFISIEAGCHENDQYYVLIHENAVADLKRRPDTIRICVEDRKIIETKIALWHPYGDKMIDFLYRPMVDLKLTQFELVYLLAHILWSTHDIKGVSNTTHEIANNMTDQISNELHNYYVNEKQLVNYGPRLIKMLKLIDGSKSLFAEEQNLTLLSAVYNIFDFNADLDELCDPF